MSVCDPLYDIACKLKVLRGWGFGSVVEVLPKQVQGSKFDPRYHPLTPPKLEVLKAGVCTRELGSK